MDRPCQPNSCSTLSYKKDLSRHIIYLNPMSVIKRQFFAFQKANSSKKKGHKILYNIYDRSMKAKRNAVLEAPKFSSFIAHSQLFFLKTHLFGSHFPSFFQEKNTKTIEKNTPTGTTKRPLLEGLSSLWSAVGSMPHYKAEALRGRGLGQRFAVFFFFLIHGLSMQCVLFSSFFIGVFSFCWVFFHGLLKFFWIGLLVL